MVPSSSSVTQAEQFENPLKEGRYGWGCLKNGPLQRLNNINGFVVAYSIFAIVIGMHSNGFLNVNVTSVERRFGLDSTISGLIIAGYDIGFCVVVVFVTYLGSRSHKPHMLAIGALVYALGCFIYIIPHFTTSLYVNGGIYSELCTNISDISCDTEEGSLKNYLFVLFLGTLMNGAAATPLLTFGLAYIEDSVPKHTAPIYLGICNGAIIMGPAIGFLLGGAILRTFYVDFTQVDMESLSLVESDPTWVGAWWLGPILAIAICLLNAVFLSGYPRYLPGTSKYREDRNQELPQNAGSGISEIKGFASTVRDFPRAVLVLLKNSTLVLSTLAGCFNAMVVNGFSTFMPKFIENEFHQTSGSAAIWAGVLLVPAGIAGHVFSGWIIGKMKMNTEQLIKFCAITAMLTAVLALSALLYCENPDIAGVTRHYTSDLPSSSEITVSNLTSQCNAACKCQEEFFNPVCGSDNTLYFSACHAGCSASSQVNETTVYSGCTCISETNVTQTARAGLCSSSCNTLGAFLAIFFFVIALALMTLTGTLVLTFRVTPHSLKPLALGVQWFVVRILGSIPGPIIYGAIIDFSCTLWQRKSCGSIGTCWIYDSKTMAVYMIVLSVAALLCSVLLFGFALVSFRNQSKTSAKDNGDDQSSKRQTTSTISGTLQ